MGFQSSINAKAVYRMLLAIAIACAAPLILYAVNTNWFYPYPGSLDNFVPIGIALHYKDPNFLQDHYKISRLPWNLLQYAFRPNFQENLAQILLHATLFIANAFFCFIAGKRLFGLLPGLILAVLTSSFPLFIGNSWLGGPDYQTALASPLFFASIAALSLFNDRRIALAGLLMGVALACLVSTYSVYIQFAPCFFIITIALWAKTHWTSNRGQAFRNLLGLILWIVIGCTAAVVAMCFIHHSFRHLYRYYRPEVNFLKDMIKHPAHDVWWQPLTWEKFLDDPSLGFLAIVAIIAILEMSVICARSTFKKCVVEGAVHAAFLCELAIWAYWQFHGHHTALQAYFTHPLYGIAALSLVATFHRCLEGSTPKRPFLHSAAFSAAAAASIIFAVSIFSVLSLDQLQAAVRISLLIGLFYMVLTLGRRLRPDYTILASLILLGLMEGAAAQNWQFAPGQCQLNGAFNRFVIELSKTIESKHNADPVHTYVWADPDETAGISGPCSALWSRKTRDIAYPFAMLGYYFVGDPWRDHPAVNELSVDQLQAIPKKGDKFVISFSTDETQTNLLRQKFAEAGVTSRIIDHYTPPPGLSFPIVYVLELGAVDK